MKMLQVATVIVALAFGQAVAEEQIIQVDEDVRIMELCEIVGTAQGIYEPLPLARVANSGQCEYGPDVFVRIISRRNAECTLVALFPSAEPSPDARWDGVRVCDSSRSLSLTS